MRNCSASRRVFTFNGRSHDATAIDAKTGEIAGNIPLDGKPEFPQADGAGHIFVNIEDKSEISEIDSNTLKVLSTWPLAPCEEPSGLAFDVAHKRLFAGCGNRMMAVVDAESGKVVTTIPIGDGVDANAFDPETGFVFASCGEGTLTVAHEDTPDKYTVVENVATQKGARTMTLDPKTHEFATQARETSFTVRNPLPLVPVFVHPGADIHAQCCVGDHRVFGSSKPAARSM